MHETRLRYDFDPAVQVTAIDGVLWFTAPSGAVLLRYLGFLRHQVSAVIVDTERALEMEAA